MASERKLGAVGPVLFTANGAVNGTVTVVSTSRFKVKAGVTVTAAAMPTLNLEVKRVVSKTQMILGYPGKIDGGTVNLSAYTTALGSAVYQGQIDRPNVPADDQRRATYEQEPTLARRVIQVDEFGEFYTTENPFPVQIDGDIIIGSVAVDITDKESSPGANDYDIIRLGDGEHELDINPDGSLPVTMSGIKTPTIINIPVITAATEYIATIPATVKKFYLKNRGNGKLQVSFVTGETATKFFTLVAGSVYGEENLTLDSPLLIYFESTKANEIVEILTWE